MAKVILCEAPSWRLFDPRFHCNLATIYLAASLREAKHQVRIADCHDITSWDGERFTVNLEKLDHCDVLGISATSANANLGSRLAEAWPAQVKVLGGRHVSDILNSPQERFKHPRYFLGFDYVMNGECEHTFVDFCNTFDSGCVHADGCFLLHEDGLVPLGNPTPEVVDIASLPLPAYDLYEAGFHAGALSTPMGLGRIGGTLHTTTLVSARGCPYGCTFCSDRRTKVRYESLEQVKAQVGCLSMLGVGAIRVADDTFTIKESRAMAIADILADYGMVFRATTRVNLNNPHLFNYLAKKGCSEMGFGVEHSSPAMLKAMCKGTTAEANETAIKMAQDAGIAAQAFVIVGFPGETQKTLDELLGWLRRVRPDGVGLSLFQPYPGTDVYDFPEKYGVSIPDDCFDRMWQFVEGTAEQIVLDLPTISKQELLSKGMEISQFIDQEIRPRDRRKIKGTEEK